MVAFINPCTIITSDEIVAELTPMARQKCEEFYQEMFINELDRFCPKTLWTSVNHHREKRFVLGFLTSLLVTLVVSAGLGAAGSAVSSVNSGKIKSLQKAEVRNRELLDKLEMQIRNNTEKIREMERRIQSDMQSFRGELGELKA